MTKDEKILKILEKIGIFIGKVIIVIMLLILGATIGMIYFLSKTTLDNRESQEFADLLRIEAERYDYCPYCGKKLEYKYSCPINEGEKQRIINEYYGE